VRGTGIRTVICCFGEETEGEIAFSVGRCKRVKEEDKGLKEVRARLRSPRR